MYSQRRINQCQVEMSLIDSQDLMKTLMETSDGLVKVKLKKNEWGHSETQEDIQILFRVTEGRV